MADIQGWDTDSSGDEGGPRTISGVAPQDVHRYEPGTKIRLALDTRVPHTGGARDLSGGISVQTMTWDEENNQIVPSTSQPIVIRPGPRNAQVQDVQRRAIEPATAGLTLEEAQAERDRLVPIVFDQWKTLRDIVERHEATMQNRWVRKSKAKRRALLHEAWPDMPKDHNSDVALWQRNGDGDGKAHAKEETFLLPHMNLEDLCKTEPLPLLLNSRGRHAPDEFNAADVDRYIFGHYTNNVNKTNLTTHQMVFRDYTGTEDYGRLEPPAERPEDATVASWWLTPKAGMIVHNGLSVLRLQARIYEFLVKCCHLIMRDIPADVLTGPAYPVVDEPPQLSANTASVSSLATTRLEAKYRVPSRMDVDRIELMIATQVARLEDDLWALRINPEAWANTVLEVAEHRMEKLLGANGRTHYGMTPPGQAQFWDQVIKSIIVDRIVALGVWQVALGKARDLKWAMNKHRVYDMNLTAELPIEVAVPFFDLWQTLGRTRAGSASTLKLSVPPSPPLRHLFLRHVPSPGEETTAFVNPDKVQTTSEAELIATMLFMWGEKMHIIPLETMLDMLEHLVQRDPTARTLTSAHVREQLGQFAVLAECETQIGHFYPWGFRASVLDNAMPELAERVKADFVKRTRWMAPVSALSLGAGFVRLGVPEDGRFRYPATHKQTRENVETMREAEAGLDRF